VFRSRPRKNQKCQAKNVRPFDFSERALRFAVEMMMPELDARVLPHGQR
jgi:hypothetical protein